MPSRPVVGEFLSETLRKFLHLKIWQYLEVGGGHGWD